MIRTRVCDVYKDFVNWVDIHNHALLGLPVKLDCVVLQVGM